MNRMVAFGALLGALVAFAAAVSGSASAVSSLKPFAHFRGIVHASGVPSSQSGASPGVLEYNGGPVMRTNTTYAIYWAPSGYSYQLGYQSTINKYFADVQADSGKASNVYSVSTQYYDTTGPIAYDSTFAGGFSDTDPYPKNGCKDAPYATVCLTDVQIQAELQSYVSTHGLPVTPTTEYFLFTPLSVGSCFDSSSSVCSYSYYCAYHSNVGNLIYSNMPYADQHNAKGNCDAESHPNGNQADATINLTSHEHNESITDPFGTAWYDFIGNENGDLCNWIFGPVLGSTQYGAYDQAINTGYYELQGEYSNALADCAWSYSAQQGAPTITSFAPSSGPVGTSVTITGTNLTGATGVTFNGTSASYTVDSGTQITATVPSGAASGLISVSGPGGSGTSASAFTVTAPGATSISSFTPTSGPVGTSVTISGSGFTGASAVAFNGSAATYTVDGDSQITATVPSVATTGTITVTTPGGTATSGSPFTVTVPPPTITSATPTRAAHGAKITIIGANFTGTTSVTLRNATASYTLVSDTRIIGVVPRIAKGWGHWRVTTPGGTAEGGPFYVTG